MPYGMVEVQGQNLRITIMLGLTIVQACKCNCLVHNCWYTKQIPQYFKVAENRIENLFCSNRNPIIIT